jgi:hypothetical protein
MARDHSGSAGLGLADPPLLAAMYLMASTSVVLACAFFSAPSKSAARVV